MRSFKQMLLAVFVLTAPLLSKAQKCKFDVEKKDPFGNGSIRSVAHKIGPPSWNWNFSLEQNNDKYYIGMRIVQSGKVNDVIAKGEKIMVKLADGNIIELVMQEDVIPAYAVNSVDASIWTNHLPKVEVEREVIEKLSKSPITDIKVTIAKRDNLLPKISSKQTDRIVESAACLLK